MSSPGFIVRMSPSGPWRIGPDSGHRERVDRVFHSDSLYSALAHAMESLGFLPEWLGVTAEVPQPEIRVSSCFPYAGEHLLVPPPRHVWPPAASSKVRWKSARFVPLSAVPALLRLETLDDDLWTVEPVSECLLPVRKNGSVTAPFRVTHRVIAPVDRVTGASPEAYPIACLEFAPGEGMWCLVSFSDEGVADVWSSRVQAAFRLLADTGVGGERSKGWGRSEAPRFEPVFLPEFITKDYARESEAGSAWWLLSLFTPAEGDAVDWDRGAYSLVTRGGRVESRHRWGDEKLASRMVEEGSVVFSENPPTGSVHNVAPVDFPHPVYRSGFALAIPIPWRVQS